MEKPGVMIYFDLLPCIRHLSMEEAGLLLHACLNYGQSGIEPELTGGAAIAWAFVQQRIDRDDREYKRKTAKARYAVYHREAKKNGLQPVSFEEWQDGAAQNTAPVTEPEQAAAEGIVEEQPVSSDIGRYHPITGDTFCYPTNNKQQTTNSVQQTSNSEQQTTNSLQPQQTGAAAAAEPRTHTMPPSVEEVREYCLQRGNEVDAQRFVDYYTSVGWMIGRTRMRDWRAAVRSWEPSARAQRASPTSGQKPRPGVVTASDPGQVDPLALAAIQRMMAEDWSCPEDQIVA